MLWNALTSQTSLWSIYFKAKHLSNIHLSEATFSRCKGNGKRDWIHARDIILKYTKYFQGEGNFSFWKDTWIGEAALKDTIPACLWDQIEDKNIPVQALYNQDHPAWINIRQVLPATTIKAIDACISRHPLPHDKCIWRPTSTGSFSINSLRKVTATTPEAFPFKQIWSNYIPPKISIFLWKVIHGILPTDDKVQKCGIMFCSKCVCCKDPCSESAVHLLLRSDLAQSTWGKISQCFKIHPANYGSGQTFLQHILSSQHLSTQAGMISLLLVSLWMWETWCERNYRRYEGK